MDNFFLGRGLHQTIAGLDVPMNDVQVRVQEIERSKELSRNVSNHAGLET